MKTTRSKRVQVLMDPTSFAALEQIAALEGRSVADLMRIASEERWLVATDTRAQAAKSINDLQLSLAPTNDDELTVACSHDLL